MSVVFLNHVWQVGQSWFIKVILLNALLLSGCQTVISSVDAIMEHDDSPQFSAQQEQAFQAFDAGDYAQSVELFEAAIQIETNSTLKAKLYNGLGNSYDELDRIADSMAAYQESLKLDPKNAPVWVNLGIVQRLAGDYDAALDSYQTALELDGNLATAHSSIGSLLVLQGKPKEAIVAFKNAIAIDSNLAVSHGNLALAYAMDGQFTEAQDSLKRAVALGYDKGEIIQTRIKELQKLE